jgi:hypothetical protein
MLERVSACGVLMFLGVSLRSYRQRLSQLVCWLFFCKKEGGFTLCKRTEQQKLQEFVSVTGGDLYGMMDGVDGIPMFMLAMGWRKGPYQRMIMDYAMCIFWEFKSSASNCNASEVTSYA